ncbi:archaeal proteasome endopeptidase complex subunit beta [Candidatus Micrarchaeota archaeon]|nr:archaeal proteasome endopeptidase complex subunit beta [Candidatus Micrarchaeota archaeon]
MEARKTGTTTVGLVFKSGVVLASDRRATMGYYIASKDIDKVYQIADNIAMTIAGSVGDAQTLIRWMKAELKLYQLKHDKKPSVEAAATLLATILSQYKFYPFYVQLLVGGIDAKPRLFSVDMLGGITEEKITSTGSGSPIAIGILEEFYKEGASEEECLIIAAKSVSAAIKRDAGSGEAVDLVVVDDKGFRRLHKEDVKKLLK